MSLTELKGVMLSIEQRYKLSPTEIMDMAVEPKDTIPLSIFSNRKLGVLEALVKYMKENMGMGYAQISKVLKRDNRTIWATYDNALKKDPMRKEYADQSRPIPISIFADRSQGVLETLAKHCSTHGLSNAKIAHLLSRDNRTIWTVLNRRGGR
jgi:hypothetical protein